ncbi:MAG: hypothetical protein CMF41_03210 [Legionellales bacterium]|nr:hypothetical protein [Legionellales bacterium]
MSVRDLWFKIDKNGKLDIKKFKIFCSIVKLDLDDDQCTTVIKIFGGTITYDEFKFFIDNS